MKYSNKSIIIYTILSISVIAIIALIVYSLTAENRPIIQGIIECKTHIASSKIAGRIDTIVAREGEWVERGNLLYVISTPELHNKLEQAEALRAEAKALQREVDRGARKQQIEAARSMVDKAEAGLALAQSTYVRIERLYRKSVVTRQQYDEAKANLEAMNANLLAAKAEYSLVLSGATSEERDIVAAKVSEATSVVDEVNLYIGDGNVIAPASGMVSSIISNSGELVGVGFPVVTILGLNDCWATFNIKESDMHSIGYGKSIRGFIPALEKHVEFEVYYIASEADFATWTASRARGGFDIRTFEIRARCMDNNLKLLPGMSVIIHDI